MKVLPISDLPINVQGYYATRRMEKALPSACQILPKIKTSEVLKTSEVCPQEMVLPEDSVALDQLVTVVFDIYDKDILA